jgi:hypothetical protein
LKRIDGITPRQYDGPWRIFGGPVVDLYRLVIKPRVVVWRLVGLGDVGRLAVNSYEQRAYDRNRLMPRRKYLRWFEGVSNSGLMGLSRLPLQCRVATARRISAVGVCDSQNVLRSIFADRWPSLKLAMLVARISYKDGSSLDAVARTAVGSASIDSMLIVQTSAR